MGPARVRVSEYQDVDGLKVPLIEEGNMGPGGKRTIAFTLYEVNTGLTADDLKRKASPDSESSPGGPDSGRDFRTAWSRKPPWEDAVARLFLPAIAGAWPIPSASSAGRSPIARKRPALLRGSAFLLPANSRRARSPSRLGETPHYRAAAPGAPFRH